MSAQLVALALEKINLKKIFLCLFWAFILVLNVRFLKVYCVGIEHNFFFTWLVTYDFVGTTMYVLPFLLNIFLIWFITLFAVRNINIKTWFVMLSFLLCGITFVCFKVLSVSTNTDYSLFSQNNMASDEVIQYRLTVSKFNFRERHNICPN